MNATFPPPLSELLEEFAEIPDWDERYAFIIDLGRQLPPIDANLQTPENRVHGCMSTVWLVAHCTQNGAARMEIVADSDSLIVKGLIVILLSIFSGRSPSDVLTTDAEAVFQKLGLEQHLSPTRRNGLFSMVKRVKMLAAHAVSEVATNSAGC